MRVVIVGGGGYRKEVGDFMDWKWRTSQGSLTAAVDFHGAEVIIFHSWKDFSFPILLCWSSSPFPSFPPFGCPPYVREGWLREKGWDKGCAFVIKTPD